MQSDPKNPQAPGRLAPRVVLRAPFYAKELGTARDVTVRSGCVALLFESGIELQFHGPEEFWRALLAKVGSGEAFAREEDGDAGNREGHRNEATHDG
jgi:hypothetical protein